MQTFGKYTAQKERSTSAEDIAKIAEECGANADNEGILTDSELKTFMNVQKLVICQ